MMEFEDRKNFIFIKNGEEVNSEYIGRFDLLYCFDTKFLTLPFVVSSDNKSIAVINFDLLKEHGFSLDEIKAILHHEVGHRISVNQNNLNGIDLEYDADDYAASIIGHDTMYSALEKTKNIIMNQFSTKARKESSLNEVEMRIINIKNKKINKEMDEV